MTSECQLFLFFAVTSVIFIFATVEYLKEHPEALDRVHGDWGEYVHPGQNLVATWLFLGGALPACLAALILACVFSAGPALPTSVGSNLNHVQDQLRFRQEKRKFERLNPTQKHYYLWKEGRVDLQGNEVGDVRP